jgi:hypothetical protein
MGRVVSYTSGSFTLGKRSSKLLIRDSVYARAERGDPKNKILFLNGNPSLRLSNPVTEMTLISSLTAAALVFCPDYFVFPSRKDGKKDRSDGKRSRRRKQLLDDHKETRGNLKLKEEALNRTL